MNIKDFLDGRHNCDCKKEHICDIHYVEIGEGVLSKLREICAPFSRILLVADGNTYPLCGKETEDILSQKIVGKALFGKEIVIPNEEAIAYIESFMTEDTDFIVGIGSGVINDLCKHVSFIHNIRYAIVATAPSMDGYASVGSALILDEMKVTLNARVPYAILAESDALCTAPIDMLRSGYGDIIGKYSCLNDWKLAHLINGEYFCQFVYDTVMQTVKNTENTAKSILERDKRAIQNLMEGLVTVGIMMSFVGNSRPASGSEHHLSHFFEITGILNGTPYYLHGIDVLYAAAVTARLREELLGMTPPFPPYVDDPSARNQHIKRIYQSASDGVIALQEKVGLYEAIDTSVFEEKWEQICDVLRDAPSYDTMLGYVKDIGLCMEDFLSFYGDGVIRDAVRYAKDLKDRYTVLWPCYALGINEISF